MQLLLKKLHLFPSREDNQPGEGNSVSGVSSLARLCQEETPGAKVGDLKLLFAFVTRFSGERSLSTGREFCVARSRNTNWVRARTRRRLTAEGSSACSQRFTSFRKWISACWVTAHTQPIHRFETGRYSSPVSVSVVHLVLSDLWIFTAQNRNLSSFIY